MISTCEFRLTIYRETCESIKIDRSKPELTQYKKYGPRESCTTLGKRHGKVTLTQRKEINGGERRAKTRKRDSFVAHQTRIFPKHRVRKRWVHCKVNLKHNAGQPTNQPL